MLGWLRTNKRNVFIYAIFTVIILAFTFSLGGGGGLRSARNPNNVSVVYGTVIDREAYSNALADRHRQFERLFGDRWNEQMAKQLGLAEQVLLELENRALLQHAAEEMGLGITDTELKDEVVRLPAFSAGGQFSYERYKRALAYQHKTPKQFEEMLRQDLLVKKMQEFLLDTVYVSRAEVLDAYRNAREKVDLEYVAFDLDAYRQRERPSQAEIDAFAGKEGARVRSAYDANISDYKHPAQVRARHILIRVSSDAPDDEVEKARVEAKRLAAEARKRGADFAALAREHSQDAATAPKGGELGWFSADQMIEPFAKAAFGAKPGEIVGPVRTKFGWHVIRVEEKRPAMDRPFEEVKGEIAARLLRDDRALASARKDALELLARAAGAPDLASLKRPRGTRHGSTGPFTREAREIPGLGPSAEIIQAAFALTAKAPLAPQPLRAGDSLLVLRLKARISAPDYPPEAELAPLRRQLLERKRKETMDLWFRSERARAQREGKLQRNMKVLQNFLET
jgi:peptidyl-prolyl cis-trans isomerase D